MRSSSSDTDAEVLGPRAAYLVLRCEPNYGAEEPTSRRPRTLIGAIPSRGFAQINASTGLRRARRPAALRRAAKSGLGEKASASMRL